MAKKPDHYLVQVRGPESAGRWVTWRSYEDRVVAMWWAGELVKPVTVRYSTGRGWVANDRGGMKIAVGHGVPVFDGYGLDPADVRVFPVMRR